MAVSTEVVGEYWKVLCEESGGVGECELWQ